MLVRFTLIVMTALLLSACHQPKKEAPMIPTTFDEGYSDGCISSRMYDYGALRKDFQRMRDHDEVYARGFDTGFTDCGYSTPRKHMKYHQ